MRKTAMQKLIDKLNYPIATSLIKDWAKELLETE